MTEINNSHPVTSIKFEDLVSSSGEFTCAHCEKTFLSDRDEDEARKEFDRVYEGCSGHLKAIICDKCYPDFKRWFDSLTPEEHDRIIAEGDAQAKASL